MRLRNTPNSVRQVGQMALGLLALLCVLYTLYMAFFMPPLVKYENSAARADEQTFCVVVGRKAYTTASENYVPDAPGFKNPFVIIPSAREKWAESDCLAKTAVDTPLLIFRAIILLIVGAIFALLASRLRVA